MTLLDKALHFAIDKHSGQVRKTQDTPYILHPIEVAAIVGTMTNDTDTLCAAVLHDTIEDTDTTFDDLKEMFGRRVALLVMTETENKRKDLPAEQTWHLRKEETLTMLSTTKDMAVKMMWMGDKLSNMRSFYRSYQKEGDGLWSHFHQHDINEQAWYYRTIAECLKDLREYEAYKEYVRLTNIVFQSVEGGIEI